MMARDEMQTVNKQHSSLQVDLSNQLVKLSGKERQLTEQKASLFEDFAAGTITKEQYLDLKTAVVSEIEIIRKQKAELVCKSKDTPSSSEASKVIDLLEKLDNVQEVTSEIASFVKRITVFSSERIEIQFTFADELACLFRTVEKQLIFF